MPVGWGGWGEQTASWRCGSAAHGARVGQRGAPGGMPVPAARRRRTLARSPSRSMRGACSASSLCISCWDAGGLDKFGGGGGEGEALYAFRPGRGRDHGAGGSLACQLPASTQQALSRTLPHTLPWFPAPRRTARRLPQHAPPLGPLLTPAMACRLSTTPPMRSSSSFCWSVSCLISRRSSSAGTAGRAFWQNRTSWHESSCVKAPQRAVQTSRRPCSAGGNVGMGQNATRTQKEALFGKPGRDSRRHVAAVQARPVGGHLAC